MGPHVGIVHRPPPPSLSLSLFVSQTEVGRHSCDAQGHSDDASQVVLLGVLLQHANLVLASNLAYPQKLQDSVAAVLSSVRSPFRKAECKIVIQGFTRNSSPPTVIFPVAFISV
jgi:hypothetical protein